MENQSHAWLAEYKILHTSRAGFEEPFA